MITKWLRKRHDGSWHQYNFQTLGIKRRFELKVETFKRLREKQIKRPRAPGQRKGRGTWYMEEETCRQTSRDNTDLYI